MSVESLEVYPDLEGPVRHIFILIGGWASEEAHKAWPSPTMPPTPIYSSTGDLLRRVQSSELSLPAGQVKLVLGLKGRLQDDDVDAALAFIENNFDPRGRLIFHGHSMGGAAVQRLCRRIDEKPYYDLQRRVLAASASPTDLTYKSIKPALPTKFPPRQKVRVDLLITVDAAIGNFSGSMDRSVAQCVRTNLNYYQTTEKNVEKSKGGPNTAVNPKGTIIWNHDLTQMPLPDPDASKPPSKPDHYSIQAQLNNVIMKIFQQALGVSQVTDFWSP